MVFFSSSGTITHSRIGSFSVNGKTMSVKGATTVDIFFDAETSYRYSSAGAWETELKKKLDNAVKAGFVAVKAAAVKDAEGIEECGYRS
jgi:hypothetical protein